MFKQQPVAGCVGGLDRIRSKKVQENENSVGGIVQKRVLKQRVFAPK